MNLLKKVYQAVVSAIVEVAESAHEISEATRLLWRGVVGPSDGAGQRALNRAIGKVIKDSLLDDYNDLLFIVRAYRLARTQRTKHLPDAFIEAREAYWEKLNEALDKGLIDREIMPTLWAEARRVRLLSQAAEIIHPVDLPDGSLLEVRAYREAHSKVWWLEATRGDARTLARGYFAVGVLSAKSIVLTHQVISTDPLVVAVTVTAFRKDGPEQYGAEFRVVNGCLYGSSVGRIVVPNFVSAFRQGGFGIVTDGAYQTFRGELMRAWPRELDSHRPDGGWQYDQHGPYVDGPVTIRHAEHPPLSLPEGKWRPVMYAIPVSGQALD